MNSVIDNSITVRIQLVSVFASILLLIIVINLVKKGMLKESYSIIWIVVCVILLLVSLFTKALYKLSEILGIYYVPATLFLILITGLIVLSIHFSIVITKHEKRIKDLAQELALVQNDLLNNKK